MKQYKAWELLPEEKVYLKSEADKVITELEESHKMEAEQLLMEIVELKDYRDECERQFQVKVEEVSDLTDRIVEKDKEISELNEQIEVLKHQACKMDCMTVKLYNEACDDLIHQKYKRCLDMAEICCEKKERCYNRALRKYSKDEADYLVRKSDFWQDWEFRWLELAEKFKETK